MTEEKEEPKEEKVYKVDLTKQACCHEFRKIGINVECVICHVFYKDPDNSMPIKELNEYYKKLKSTLPPTHS